ncbi:hypothetical protein SprV_0200526900 [Sparganum proliferum]
MSHSHWLARVSYQCSHAACSSPYLLAYHVLRVLSTALCFNPLYPNECKRTIRRHVKKKIAELSKEIDAEVDQLFGGSKRFRADCSDSESSVGDLPSADSIAWADTVIHNDDTNFLVCLGGRNTDDFVKSVFYALFDDEACIHVNFRGKKTKEGLCGSQVYEVIKDVYTAWNKGGRVDVYELEAAFTRRLKRSLDGLRKRRSQPDSHFDDSDEPSTESSSSRSREE